MKLGLLPGFLRVHVVLAGPEKLFVEATLVRIISRNLSCGCDLCYLTSAAAYIRIKS